ncbi:MAG: ABC transporter substrate-binding protein [Alphaproteobacteria bacterium]|nr:ABC transporter substrate-binding protein [Alphaproteobacteria bacterium]
MRIAHAVLIAAVAACLPSLAAANDQRPTPSQWIQLNADKVLALENTPDPAKRYDEAKQLVQYFVDVQALSTFACARVCRSLTEDQTNLFRRDIADFIAIAYASSTPILSNLKWEIIGHDDSPPSATVLFGNDDGPAQSITVRFIMRTTADGYKITDITVSDISFAQKLRQTVAQAFASADTPGDALQAFSNQTDRARNALFGVAQPRVQQQNLGEL